MRTDEVKPPPDRLYGSSRGHALRPRQRMLLDVTLPRLAITAEQAADPRAAFDPEPDRLWLEVGFGGGEHALAQVAANANAGLIACEVFENGICSLLGRLVPEGEEATAPCQAISGFGRMTPASCFACCRLHASTACSSCSPILGRSRATPSAGSSTRPALTLLARALRRGAEWRVATDDPIYQEWVAETLADQAFFDGRGRRGRTPGRLAAYAL